MAPTASIYSDGDTVQVNNTSIVSSASLNREDNIHDTMVSIGSNRKINRCGVIVIT